MAPNIGSSSSINMNSRSSHIPFYDVIVIGAGVSGIGAAASLKRETNRSFHVLERRATYGGTWDLFKYPGIRSDSSMRTFAYSFHPWKNTKSFVSGAEIKAYIGEVIDAYDLQERISYNQHVLSLNFDTESGLWTIQTSDTTFRCRFIFSGTGYYDQDKGFTPDFPGISSYEGQVIHPQKWPENFNYDDKSVIIIGSGATAVTLAPSMCDRTKSLTILQRSPTYMIDLPQYVTFIPFLFTLCSWFPVLNAFVLNLIKFSEIIVAQISFFLSKVFPAFMKKNLLNKIKTRLPGDMKHFTPRYNPWDQRLCVVPDGDLFKAVESKKIAMVTDTIDRFTKEGILTSSGQELKADVVITATGLVLQFLGKAKVSVDDKELTASDCAFYRGTMLTGIPNLFYGMGYTNSSWTLKLGLIYSIFTQTVNYMDDNRLKRVQAIKTTQLSAPKEFGGLTSGYFTRGSHMLPQIGTTAPWNIANYYFVDWFNTKRFDCKKEKELVFS